MSTTKKFVFHNKTYEELSDGSLAKLLTGAAATASQTATVTAAVTVNADGVATFAFGIPAGPTGPMGPAGTSVGVCSTAIGTAAKEVSIAGFTLSTGSCVFVTFTNGNSAANATLSVNSTTACDIKYYTSGSTKAAVPAYYIQPGDTLCLIYDGTDWVIIDNDDYGDLDADYDWTPVSPTA